jgi:hypothetical protein
MDEIVSPEGQSVFFFKFWVIFVQIASKFLIMVQSSFLISGVPFLASSPKIGPRAWPANS